MFVVPNKNRFSTNIGNHNIDTRKRNNLYPSQANLTIYQKEAYYSGINIFNNVPMEIKDAADNLEKFKVAYYISISFEGLSYVHCISIH
jgi:ABC-type transporter Mla maintaining outer membrane lipid asymmetry ATPase subunit MlaF